MLTMDQIMESLNSGKSMSSQAMYQNAYEICTDLLTGLVYKSWSSEPLKSVIEDNAMYNRHNDGTLEYSYELDPVLSKYNCYSPNPFDSSLKEAKEDITVIPKDPNDPRDIPWVLVYNNDEKEKGWVNDHLDMMGNKIYLLSLDTQENKEKFKFFGSLCHRGFVNKIFDHTHTSNMRDIRDWVNNMGSDYDEKKVDTLRSQYHDSIYRGGHCTRQVHNICDYCEKMFGVSRYEVAKCFKLKDPSYFIKDEYKYNAHHVYFVEHIAAIHAEKGDYMEATKYYQRAIDLCDDKSHQRRVQEIKDNFENYYSTNGTTILSSNF